MSEPEGRTARLPDLEGGLNVPRMILNARRWAQFLFLDGPVVFAFAWVLWRFGAAGTITLVAAIGSGLLGGSFLKGLQTLRERVRLVRTFAEVADPRESKPLWDKVNAYSRPVFGALIASGIGGVVATVAGLSTGARWWAVVLCIVGLAYCRSLLRVISPVMDILGNKIRVGSDSQFRIILFRSFGEGAAKLAKDSLIPLLAGYGSVDVVLDPSLDSVASSGSFDLRSSGWSRLCRIHQFRHEEWKARVSALLEDTDLAVIDVGRITEGVMWEVAESYRRLPPWRVWPLLDLSAYTEPGALTDYVHTFSHELGQAPDVPCNVRFRWSYFIGGGWIHLDFLAAEFHRRMTELVAIETEKKNREGKRGRW